MANPVFTSSPMFNARKAAPVTTVPAPQPPSAEQLAIMYAQPAATPVQTGRLTYEDVIVKTAGLLGIVVLAGAVGWTVARPFAFPAMIVGLVLGLVNTFKKKPSPALIIAYAAVEGLFLGALSGMLEELYPGVAIQAVLATVVTFGVVLVAYRSGKIRVTGRFLKIVLIAAAAYFVFSLVNLGLQLAGVLDGWGVHSIEIAGMPLGVVLGIAAVILASACLVMDFDQVQTAVRRGAPREYSWYAAFGLTVTIVWLYLEFLRLLAILRR